ncbi:ribonucleotide-diphosphate reductase subunit beta [Kitasatospora sp. NPDC088346]|uniref:ribonucleotide-diphosphate reductase subunit beta n=1 Tax=Kitasatospora sp. NPDC088346 TaxID=3364073 RepID=UPI003817F971
MSVPTLVDAGFVPDITDEAVEEPAEKVGRLATSADLYRRWERQQWSVAEVNPRRDAAGWQALRPFSQEQLLGSLAELEVGEVCVTQTLGSLTDHPQTEDDRIYLCTQMADEARHVRFFQTYIEDACGVPLHEQEGRELEAAADYATVFAPELTRVTSEVRVDGSPEAWYRALVYYHLITEGVLAATALRTTRFLAKRLRLAALEEGLTNVTRDESRHVSFGLRAATDGVNNGYREIITDSHFEAVDMAAWVLIGPARHNPSPAIPAALASRAAQLQGSVDIGRERLLKQLRIIGLPELVERVDQAWSAGIDKALDAYQARWDAPHPIRAAAARA